jgi:hypothetical protein
LKEFANYSGPAHSHADAMQIFHLLHGTLRPPRFRLRVVELMARPKRFELLTSRFVAGRHAVGIAS